MAGVLSLKILKKPSLYAWGLFVVLVLSAGPQASAATLVHSTAEFNAAIASAAPGSVITIANGTYSNFGVYLSTSVNGASGNPIVVQAETPGGVIFTGNSYINIAASYIQVSGITFSGVANTNISIAGNGITVTGCTFANSGTTGGAQVITVSNNATDGVVSQNTFTGSLTTSIYIYPRSVTLANTVQITNNTFQTISGSAPVMYLGFSGSAAGATNDSINSNTFVGVTSPIASVNSSGNTFTSNTADAATTGLLVFAAGTTNTVNGTTVVASPQVSLTVTGATPSSSSSSSSSGSGSQTTSLQVLQVTVSSAAQLSSNLAIAAPGSVITLADGTYTNFSVNIASTINGSSGSPITIQTQTPGGVTLTGTSHFNIIGNYITLSGFTFSGISGNAISINGNNDSVTNSTFIDSGISGGAQVITIASTALNADISQNTFTNSLSASIYAYPSSATPVTTNTRIRNNVFQSISGTSPVVYVGFVGNAAGSTGYMIDSNSFNGVSSPIASINSSGNTISNTTLSTSPGLITFASGTTNTLNGVTVIGLQQLSATTTASQTQTGTGSTTGSGTATTTTSGSTTTTPTSPLGAITVGGVTVAPVTTDTSACIGFVSRITVSGQILPCITSLLPAVRASAAGQSMIGTSGNDNLAYPFVAPASLAGGPGDDLYSIAGPDVSVVEYPGEGVADTVVEGFSYYKLPANVEDLKGTGTNPQVLVGNDAPNLILGAAGNTQIDGGPGNDVLSGGSGITTFVLQRGNGSDVITNFKTGANGDIVRLQGYSFTTFAAVTSAMTQFGNDVVLDLGGGEVLVFRKVTIGAFVVANFSLPIDISNKYLSFNDDFNALDRCINDYSSAATSGCTGGIWRTNTGFGNPLVSAGYRYYPANSEQEINVDPEFPGIDPATGKYRSTPLGINPFSISSGILTISANRTPASALPYLNNQPYTSGYMTTKNSFSQTYGYFEMRAKFPSGKGFWPAFWMLSSKGGWPPEIDIVEGYGSKPNIDSTTIHYMSGGSNLASGLKNSVPDTSVDFHQYGVDWEPDFITFYFDRVPVYRVPTPAQLVNVPMYLIANLAVGGAWDGNPDTTTPFPGNLQIDYIRAYSNTPVASVVGPIGAGGGSGASTNTGSNTNSNTTSNTTASGGGGAQSTQGGVTNNPTNFPQSSNTSSTTGTVRDSIPGTPLAASSLSSRAVSSALITTPLLPGATGAQVELLQKFLIAKGLLTIPSNIPLGYYGPATQQAVAAFQKQQQIVSTGDIHTTGLGAVGPKTLAAINDIAASTSASTTSMAEATPTSTPSVPDVGALVLTQSLWLGVHRSEVVILQSMLNKLGYTVAVSGPGSAGNETDFFGPATNAAVIKFQQTYSLTSDPTALGIVGPITRTKLNQLYSK